MLESYRTDAETTGTGMSEDFVNTKKFGKTKSIVHIYVYAQMF